MRILRSQIDSLEQEIPELDRKRSSYSQTLESARKLQDGCLKLRQDSQLILDELLQARAMLSRIKMKVELIASELSECGYVRTRREIGEKLREILTDFQSVGKSRAIKFNNKAVAQALGKLLQIEGRTQNVLMIMDKTG